MINTFEKSNLSYMLNWLISDIYKALDLIIRDANSQNKDILLRYEVLTALWAAALIKLSKFTDYIEAIADVKITKDRKRAIKYFNLENSTVIPDCSIKEIPVIKLLRKARNELTHGASGALNIQPLKYIVVIDEIAYVQCLTLDYNENCNKCGNILICNRDSKNHKIAINCKISISDVVSSLSTGINIWAKKYKTELEKAVLDRRNSHINHIEKKPNNYIPWWYEPQDELFAYSL